MDSEIHTWSLLGSFVGWMMGEEFFKRVATFALDYLKVTHCQMLSGESVIASFLNMLSLFLDQFLLMCGFPRKAVPVIWSLLGSASVMV